MDEDGSVAERLAEAGLELREENGRVLADTVVFGSAAQDAGLDMGWEINHLQVAADRPPKY